ncbi:A disintegrin and metalloproteinase with thrombospondin motifs 8-like [Frieseomelitta varia]|uniref:A disintegrin and metalloproteinase with thrombospondin motifs 8-like n=1 Tax=Frieseomelitta varia TaxID=561572 RepID=UPI001CB6A75A|nr:A disintegrin and metalloproteinase with thrombospondin motifs 8-like [Frieseomelitta varia]
MINPGDDSHPNHHRLRHSDYKVPRDRINVARVQLNLERASTFIHLTRSNICDSPSLCGFTGASTIAGTCDPLKGAAIINDVGLHTGYRIAHHIGHTLGMSHDVQEENDCPGIVRHRKGYIETTVMHLGNTYVTKRWSKCSRSSLKSYIEFRILLGRRTT